MGSLAGLEDVLVPWQGSIDTAHNTLLLAPLFAGSLCKNSRDPTLRTKQSITFRASNDAEEPLSNPKSVGKRAAGFSRWTQLQALRLLAPNKAV